MEVLARILYVTGLIFWLGLLRQRFGRRRLIIPMYHRVRPATDGASDALLEVERGIPADRFEEHLRVFARFGKLLPLSDAYNHLLDEQALPRTVIAITFDDGYRDNLTEALPILAQHCCPATLFPALRVLDGDRLLWWDELANVVRSSGGNGRLTALLDEVPAQGAANGTKPYESRYESRAEMATALLAHLGSLPRVRRDRVLAQLHRRTEINSDAEPRLYLNWSELQCMQHNGVEVGGHTIDHPALLHESAAEAFRQIHQSREELERRLETSVHSFAYPHGAYSSLVRRLVQQAGYRLAVTVEHGVNYPETNPFKLRRMPLSHERPFELAFKLAFYDWVHSRRQS
jgi:peptidoglycan/xylan/chitin deacetylase (PgdA/CDA1 family)